MIVEGKGQVVPSPVNVAISADHARLLKREAVDRAQFRDYSKREGRWAPGLKRGIDDEVVGYLDPAQRPCYAGLMGEMATCLYLGPRIKHPVNPDLERRELGDFGFDLVLYDVKIQVKTRQRWNIPNLLKRFDDRGYLVSIPADICVFCLWRGGLDVHLIGWIWLRSIRRRPAVPAMVGDHRNIEVVDRELLPMCRLVSILLSKKLGL